MPDQNDLDTTESKTVQTRKTDGDSDDSLTGVNSTASTSEPLILLIVDRLADQAEPLLDIF